MFDFHLHSKISFDGRSLAKDIADRAAEMGLREICFTDHWDYNSDPAMEPNLFSLEDYAKTYDTLSYPNMSVRRGVEFGLTTWNQADLRELLAKRRFDFVIGSVHFVDGCDPYEQEFWKNKNTRQAYSRYLEAILDCVRVHEDFDVLGHLTYVCRSIYNPDPQPLRYEEYSDLTDAIMKELVAKGRGMEINTSGVDSRGVLLPDTAFLKRFQELGGEIITIGSDAHAVERVGQHASLALQAAKDIFGYVCTFENRKPIFHKL